MKVLNTVGVISLFYYFSDSQVMPGNSSGLFSFIAVSWMTKLMWKAYRHGLTQDDLYELDVNYQFFYDLIYFSIYYF